MPPRAIEPSDAVESELNAFLDERIYEFNIEATGFNDGRPLSAVIRDEAGNVVAAINGHTWGGCCHVAHLWVSDSCRRQGYGSALLKFAEQEATRRACGQVQLLTHSFQAPQFYERAGYLRVATIENYPQGHGQYVYVKQFAGAGGA